ncbi:hypothetical protein VKT23_010105 [Stygiomarasmius scandens]|uniref:F-box domain-containing protein n=1 Tax=Marasmiellus scandens TaxID=2682957 RepID=A0ABR1JEQ0_9AGAR
MPLLPQTTHDLLLRELSPVERVRFSKVSKEAHAAVQSFNKRAFRIEKLLSRYFDTPQEINQFRQTQYRTGILISGSSALQFFDCSEYDSDLDLYVHFEKCRPVIDFLLSIGYVFQPSSKQSEDVTLALNSTSGETYSGPIGLRGVLNFSKNQKKIQIITCDDCPIQVILQFHSTCVINVMSHSHAYSIFPRATFHGRGSVKLVPMQLLLGEASVNYHSALVKYEERGWSLAKFPSAPDFYRQNSEFFLGARHIGDAACWTIALSRIDGLSEREMSLEADTLRGNSWRQTKAAHNNFKLVHCLFRWQKRGWNYVVPALFSHYSQNESINSEIDLVKLLCSKITCLQNAPTNAKLITDEILKMPDFPDVPYQYHLSVDATKILSDYYTNLNRSWRVKNLRIAFNLKPNDDPRKPPRLSTTVIYSIFYIYEEDSYIPHFGRSFKKTDDVSIKVVDSDAEEFVLYEPRD